MGIDVLHTSLDTLAQALGIGRRSAYRYRNDGAPKANEAGAYSENEWRAWCRAADVTLGEPRPRTPKPEAPEADAEGDTLDELRRVKTERERIKLAIDRKQVVPVAYVERMAEQIALTCLSVLLEAPASLAQQFPEIDGRTFRDRCQGVLDAGRRKVATDMVGILQTALGDPPEVGELETEEEDE